MEQVILNAQTRKVTGKESARRLRKEGKIPAVFYGKNRENLHLAISPLDLEKATATEMGMNAIIKLKVGEKGDFDVIIRDYQADVFKRNFLHADFVSVDLKKKIEISVPIRLLGRPAGVKEGGILEQITRELVVLCLPTHIPKQIEVDVSGLKIGQNLHLDELKLPEGVEPREKINVTIAAVAAQKEEELTPGTMTEPEVLTAKKEEGVEGAVTPEAKQKEASAETKPEQKSGEKEKK